MVRFGESYETMVGIWVILWWKSLNPYRIHPMIQRWPWRGWGAATHSLWWNRIHCWKWCGSGQATPMTENCSQNVWNLWDMTEMLNESLWDYVIGKGTTLREVQAYTYLYLCSFDLIFICRYGRDFVSIYEIWLFAYDFCLQKHKETIFQTSLADLGSDPSLSIS